MVDLCAAPGSWSQVCAMKLADFILEDQKWLQQEKVFEFPNGNMLDASGNIIQRRHRVVSVDLQDMSPIFGVHLIKGDITEVSIFISISAYSKNL